MTDCAGCGSTLGDGSSRHSIHAGRGLCVSCHGKASHLGQLENYPRRTWSRDELLDEWELLRGEGHTRVQAAERLGMNPTAFERALQRARAAGDPRAAPGVAGGMNRFKVAPDRWVPAHQMGDDHAMAR